MTYDGYAVKEVFDMFNGTIGKWYRDEKEKLRPMSWRSRLDHLWTYYRFHALAIIGTVLIIIFAIQGQILARQDVLISGSFINTDTSCPSVWPYSQPQLSCCGGKREGHGQGSGVS